MIYWLWYVEEKSSAKPWHMVRDIAEWRYRATDGPILYGSALCLDKGRKR